MLDIRLIREKPDFVRERLATRGGGDEMKIDEALRVATFQTDREVIAKAVELVRATYPEAREEREQEREQVKEPEQNQTR